MAPRQSEPDSDILTHVYELLLDERKYRETQFSGIYGEMTAIRCEISSVRELVAALPCKQHADEIADAKKAALDVQRSYNLAKLVAGVGTAVTMVVAAVTGIANNVASMLGIGRIP